MKAERLLGVASPRSALVNSDTTRKWHTSEDYASAKEALESSGNGHLCLGMDGTCSMLQVMGSGDATAASVAQQLSSVGTKDFFWILWKEQGKRPILFYYRGRETPVARRSMLLEVSPVRKGGGI